MKREITFYLKDILDAIENIGAFLKEVHKEDFLKNIEKQSAVIRQLEIIGEAAKNISNDLKRKYPNIPWKDIVGFRDIATHAYFRLNLTMVWEITQKDISDLKKKILKIKEDFEKNS